ncbi:MAG: amidohydrolase family protein [archaeon]|nr:amidohydrolase family protein [archaeon]
MFDKLVVNSKIYSLENEGEFYDAMAIDKGKIVKLYDKEPWNANSLAKEIIDVEGKTIIPGLIDSHFHFAATATTKIFGLNVTEFIDGKIRPASLDEFRIKLQKYASTLDKKLPVLCFGYIMAQIKEERLPFWKELDEWVPNRSIIVFDITGHSCSLSSKGLRQYNIDPSNHNGILTGEEFELDPTNLMKSMIKYATPGRISLGVQLLLNELIENGIVGISNLDGFYERFAPIIRSYRLTAGSFPIYFRLYPQFRQIKYYKKHLKSFLKKRVGGCGFWCMDGASGAQTAAFDLPYLSDQNNYGALLYEEEDVYKDVLEAHTEGCQISVHAVGTMAIERILKCYERVFDEKECNDNLYRHRIEHYDFPTKEQVDRTLNRGILISPQAGYIWLDCNYMKHYEKYLHPDIVKRLVPLKTINDRGGFILGSSDSPVQHLNPFIQISGMVNYPVQNENLSVYEALRTYTYNGAYGTFEENTRGTLAKGKNADFIILEEDPFKIPKESINELKVLSTFIQGNKPARLNYNTIQYLMKCLFGKKKKI